ncbi:NeuD/PglB/VioB family sugar acetyltransferase [Cytophagales bacterium LB-30]|uniref:NeuD/PglB/VioB family sugar acetyltransferase n=1 Tax=Shiella aurantiaca TaxID=3058365 RepID=A0ABT8F8B4_9BACT|nr:NeuD/PglB/VioB family sugar acetyltransferase [Shiella aurantiaca]MDN4166628.1 NeuD/PglB/VioB family sugar acetyltransferase [Shiella aurantiaca]
MKTPLYILGAGNVGAYLCYNIKDFPEFEVVGLFDDAPEKQGKILYGFPVLDTITNCNSYLKDNSAVAICIHAPQVKKRIYQKIKGLSLMFPNFISPYAWVSPSVKLGKGLIIYPGVSINYECVLGDFVNMNMNCAIGHNVTVNSYASLAPGVNLGGFTWVGEGVDFGIGACTIQNMQIGADSTVGGQAMIITSFPENSKIIGVPAKAL